MNDQIPIPNDPVPASRVSGRARADRDRLERVLAENPSRGRLPRLARRGLAWGIGASFLALGIGGYLVSRTTEQGVEIRLGGTGSPGSASAPAADEWGVEATLKVTPREGSNLTPREAGERLARIVSTRHAPERFGYTRPQALVLSTGDGEVRVRMPWARRAEQVSLAYSGADVSIYDSARDVLGTAKDEAELRAKIDELRRTRGSEQTERYFVGEAGGLFDPGADPRLIDNPLAMSGVDAPGTSPLDVPESVRVVLKAYLYGEPPPGPGDDRFILLRAKPLIESDEILRTEFIGDATTRLTLLSREKDGTSTADVRALTIVSRNFGQSTALESLQADWRRDSGKEELDLTVRQDRSGWPLVTASPGGLPGAVSVADLSTYGTPPPRLGTKPSADADPPPTVSSAQYRVKKREDTLLRVLTLNIDTSGNGPGDNSNHILAIDTVIGEDGHEYYTDANARIEGGDCELSPSFPLIAPCEWASGDQGDPNYVVGRVSSRISTLELHTKGGDVLPVHVENGWMAAFPDSSQSFDRLVGRDSTGKVLAEFPFQTLPESTGSTTDASQP